MKKAIYQITSILFALTLAFGGFSNASAAGSALNSMASGKTYFVSVTKGSDSNPGSLAAPWRTIQKAANSVKAGDVVKVLAGNYSDRVKINRSGAAGSPITFMASGRVIMRGFTVYGNYISIKGFEITNTPNDDVAGIGIFVRGSNCAIEKTYIHDATRGGILLKADLNNYAGTSRCRVIGNRLYKNAQFGIEVQGNNHLIEGNEVWGTIQYHPKWTNPPSWADADGITFFGNGHILRKNYVHDILFGVQGNKSPHIDCFQSWGDQYHLPANNITIEQNRCDNAQAQNEEETGKGIMITDNTGWLIIRNNQLNAFINIYLEDGKNAQIINNTLVSNPTLNPDFYPSGITVNYSTNVVIKNNLFYNQPGHIIYVRESSLTSSNNLVYRNDGQDLWTTNTYDHSADLWNVNPGFIDPAAGDYHLQTNSPAINAGLDLANVPNDMEGRLRPQGNRYDIGAFEKIVP